MLLQYRACLVSIIAFGILVNVSCELSDILKLCENEACEISEQRLMSLNETADYRKRMYKLISAGIPQILWDEIADMRSKQLDIGQRFSISKTCADSVVKVSEGLEDLYEWAFRMMDASGKTPSAYLESTVTSFGDYDECLDIHTPGFDGQYCMPDLFPLKTKEQQTRWPRPSRSERAATGKVNLGDIAVFKGMSFNFALCVPSTCTAEEVRNVLAVVLEPYLLKPAGALSCDTKGSVSYGTRLSNLTLHQTVAFAFIGSILAAIFLGTAYHVLLIALAYQHTGKLLVTVSPVVSAISIVDNVQQLVKPSSRDGRDTVLDIGKLVVVLFGVCGHVLACVEIPISYYAYQSHTYMNAVFGTAQGQIITNESGLNMITFLGGVTTYSIMVPLAKKKKLPFFSAIFDRWVRFAPSVLCITAIEFIWPVLWSGPLFTRVADFTIHKCTATWWKNLLFINNWFPVIDICAGHTFSTSVDFQLFILGLIATYITVKSAKAGLAFSGLMIIYGWFHIAYNAYYYQTTGSLYVPDPILTEILSYLDNVHMHTAVYIPSFFIGYLAGRILSAGYRLPLSGIRDHIKWIVVVNMLYSVVFIQNILYNGLGLIPHSWAPMQININRTFQTLGSATLFFYLSSVDSIFGYKLKYDNNNVQEKSRSKFDFVSTICRLSYSIYLSNYVLIKSEFFGQKVLYPADLYLSVKRIVSTTIFVILFAFVFHLFFIAPFSNLRRILLDRKATLLQAKKET
ncbi:hypothetical protein HDE_02217 [Halotydeus destructor]|nr:hypothetical protein HDE_02217 [Halotydeus destructor]